MTGYVVTIRFAVSGEERHAAKVAGKVQREDAPMTRARCSSYTAMQARCTLYAGHDGPHEDPDGMKWANEGALPDGRATDARVEDRLWLLVESLNDTAALLEGHRDAGMRVIAAGRREAAAALEVILKDGRE